MLTCSLLRALSLILIAAVAAQTQTPAPPLPPTDRAAITAASAAERDRELKLLGITAMQPPATAYDIGKPGNANYDESKANPYPKLPDVLAMNDGTKVTTPAQWKKRRAEIKAMFDENVYGKYPAHIPAVTWKVDSVEQITVQGIPAIVKHITGHVDNSAYPAITVDIHADVVTPASTKGTKVPVIIGGGSIRPRPAFPRPARAGPGGASARFRRPMRPILPSCCWTMAGALSAATPAKCRPTMAPVSIKASSAW